MATEFEITDVPDEAPETDNPVSTTGDYDPQYPGSTPDAPYGFKPDGTPYKRRPRGTGGSKKTVGRMPATDSMATQAAALLASANNLLGMGLHVFGMPMTSERLQEANKQFEAMAFQALLSDPALCRKILANGAVGGKAMLAMAYLNLGASLYPVARQEFTERKVLTDGND